MDDNTEVFLNQCIKDIDKVTNQNETIKVAQSHADVLIDQLLKEPTLTKFSKQRVGSFFEGTMISDPYQFDYLLCINLNSILTDGSVEDIEITSTDIPTSTSLSEISMKPTSYVAITAKRNIWGTFANVINKNKLIPRKVFEKAVKSMLDVDTTSLNVDVHKIITNENTVSLYVSVKIKRKEIKFEITLIPVISMNARVNDRKQLVLVDPTNEGINWTITSAKSSILKCKDSVPCHLLLKGEFARVFFAQYESEQLRKILSEGNHAEMKRKVFLTLKVRNNAFHKHNTR